jgi:hypothetical protein
MSTWHWTCQQQENENIVYHSANVGYALLKIHTA